MKLFARDCYVKNRVSLFQFEELLNGRLDMNVEYIDKVKGDAAFEYTEMTNYRASRRN